MDRLCQVFAVTEDLKLFWVILITALTCWLGRSMIAVDWLNAKSTTNLLKGNSTGSNERT